MVQRKNIFSAKDADGKDVDLVGYAIAWTYTKSEFPMIDVVEAFKKNNLPTKCLEKGKERISFVLRALNKVKEGKLLRQVEETNDTIRYQFTSEYIAEDNTGKKYVGFKADEFVVYDKNNDKILADTYEKEVMFRELLAHCSETFTNADITRYTQSLFNEAKMIPLRGRGSFYFVPAMYSTLVNNVKNMFETIDPDGWFTLIEMPNMKNTKDSIKSSYENDMQDKLDHLKIELKKIQDSKDSLTPRLYRSRMDDIAAWAKDLEMYADLTSYTLDDAKSCIGEAMTMLNTFMETGNLPTDEKKEGDAE